MKHLIVVLFFWGGGYNCRAPACVCPHTRCQAQLEKVKVYSVLEILTNNSEAVQYFCAVRAARRSEWVQVWVFWTWKPHCDFRKMNTLTASDCHFNKTQLQPPTVHKMEDVQRALASQHNDVAKTITGRNRNSRKDTSVCEGLQSASWSTFS